MDIPEDLISQLKERAAREGTTVETIVRTALRQFLAQDHHLPGGFRLKDGSFRGSGLAPGIREGDWEQIRDIIYEGRGS